MNKFKIINSEKAPKAIGPYSQGIIPVKPGIPVYLSGQLGIDPKTGELASDEINGQTEQVFKNIRAVLEAGGLALDDITRCEVLLDNMEDYIPMNEIYAKEFGKHKPARAAYAAKKLPKGAMIEIVATAWKEN